MRRFLASVGALFALCTLLSGAARWQARHTLPPTVLALLPDESCPAPCWQGLRPGYWTGEEIERWLENPPHDWAIEEISRTGDSAYLIHVIRLPGEKPITLALDRTHSVIYDRLVLEPHDLALGDLLSGLDRPSYYEYGETMDPDRPYFARLYFPEYMLHVIVILPHGDNTLSPDSPVKWVQFIPLQWHRPLLAQDWAGPAYLSEYASYRGTP
ncbi:MAG: hypothetical protein HY866_07660 [Chloroflexi bacterium]|nr:hypothetical protein [Chloroflexota bacterium]